MMDLTRPFPRGQTAITAGQWPGKWYTDDRSLGPQTDLLVFWWWPSPGGRGWMLERRVWNADHTGWSRWPLWGHHSRGCKKGGTGAAGGQDNSTARLCPLLIHRQHQWTPTNPSTSSPHPQLIQSMASLVQGLYSFSELLESEDPHIDHPWKSNSSARWGGEGCTKVFAEIV